MPLGLLKIIRIKWHLIGSLRLKSIPYLFFSSSSEQKHVIDAYSRSNQGFLVKPSSYNKLKKIIVKIVKYWQECELPNLSETLNNILPEIGLAGKTTKRTSGFAFSGNGRS